MYSYLRSYDIDSWHLIEIEWKFLYQTLKNVTMEPKSFNDWNEEEFYASEKNYIRLYSILKAMSSNEAD